MRYEHLVSIKFNDIWRMQSRHSTFGGSCLNISRPLELVFLINFRIEMKNLRTSLWSSRYIYMIRLVVACFLQIFENLRNEKKTWYVITTSVYEVGNFLFSDSSAADSLIFPTKYFSWVASCLFIIIHDISGKIIFFFSLITSDWDFERGIEIISRC